jgi:NADH-quinone oxidoreductase subunit C
MPTLEKIVEWITPVCKTAAPVVDAQASPKAVKVHASDILAVCNELYRNPGTYFDMLSCLTGLDNGPQAGTMEVIYNLYSIPFNLHLMVKVTLPRDQPMVDSVTSIWRTADWHEREAFDMYGITFRNHPDLRRILMPADWEGYPLRKDYKHQEYYRNIKVEYESSPNDKPPTFTA